MHRTALATALLAVAVAVPATAQRPRLVVGVKGGLTASDLALTDAQHTSAAPRTSFGGGAFAGIKIAGPLAFQPEALFRRKGADADDGGVPVRFAIDYLEVPLVARLTLAGSVAFRPVVYAGPSFAVELGCRVDTIDLGDDPLNDPRRIPVSAGCDAAGQPHKRFDAGLLGGVGLDIDVGVLVLSLEGRYTLGLVNIDDVGVAGESIRNRSASGIVGIGVPLR